MVRDHHLAIVLLKKIWIKAIKMKYTENAKSAKGTIRSEILGELKRLDKFFLQLS